MCIIFIVITGFLSISFFLQGDLILAIINSIIFVILSFFFMKNLIKNGPCLFGKRSDCKKNNTYHQN